MEGTEVRNKIIHTEVIIFLWVSTGSGVQIQKKFSTSF